MPTTLEKIYQLLNGVLPGKVSYGTNIVDALAIDVLPFIVYQEISDRSSVYADNVSVLRIVTIQITFVTEKKDPLLEGRLEEALYLEGFNYQMITEYLNDDNSVNRVYEIKLEE